MTEKKLPTGVGKKIVEALKKQDEIDLGAQQDTTIVENSDEITFGMGSGNDNQFYENSFAQDEVNELDLNQIDEAPMGQEQDSPIYEEPAQFVFEPVQDYNVAQEPQNDYATYQQPVYEQNTVNNYQSIDRMQSEPIRNFNMPSNVAVLRRLIAQLPNGVSKQTGAQIIRQTMEALGISMNNVLAEAQQVQDGLNGSIKDCMTTVNEYKQNIMTLEKQVVDYQKQVKAVNDLISLFILTDK